MGGWNRNSFIILRDTINSNCSCSCKCVCVCVCVCVLNKLPFDCEFFFQQFFPGSVQSLGVSGTTRVGRRGVELKETINIMVRMNYIHCYFLVCICTIYKYEYYKWNEITWTQFNRTCKICSLKRTKCGMISDISRRPSTTTSVSSLNLSIVSYIEVWVFDFWWLYHVYIVIKT